jgi:hypothetical protein
MDVLLVWDGGSPTARPGTAGHGGLAEQLRGLGRALADRGHAVRMLARGPGDGDPGFAVRHVDAPAPVALAAALGELVEQRRPDVIHAHSWSATLAALVGGGGRRWWRRSRGATPPPRRWPNRSPDGTPQPFAAISSSSAARVRTGKPVPPLGV